MTQENSTEEPTNPVEEGLKNDFHKKPFHLIQGPPGTGKTYTSARYIYEWMPKQEQEEPGKQVLISAPTHKAVEELFEKLAQYKRWMKIRGERSRDLFLEIDKRYRKSPKNFSAITITNNETVDKEKIQEIFEEWDKLNYRHYYLKSGAKNNNQDSYIYGTLSSENNSNGNTTPEGGIVIGALTSQVINYIGKSKLGNRLFFKANPDSSCEFEISKDGFDFLLLDEASMMKVPEFIPLIEVCKKDAPCVIVGDDLQLGPITQHDWGKEIRPSLNDHTPWNSVFHYLKRHHKGKLLETPLTETWRLPYTLTELIKPIYKKAGIDLTSKKESKKESKEESKEEVDSKAKEIKYPSKIDPKIELTWVSYSGESSSTENTKEAEMVKRIVEGLLDCSSGDTTIGVVTPFNRQIFSIKKQFATIGDVTKKEAAKKIRVDTVHKFQGGEEDIIIFSAVVCGPEKVAEAGAFLFDKQLTNVAFSRAKKRLIIIASEDLMNHIPANFEEYQGALLWKNLRMLCCP